VCFLTILRCAVESTEKRLYLITLLENTPFDENTKIKQAQKRTEG
jgi:hypothetical protein